MAKLLSATEIVHLLTQRVGDLRPGDLTDLSAALSRIPGAAHGDHPDLRSQEKTLAEILTGGFGAAS
jgi:Mg-chelatase subunit ChlD